MAFSLRKWISSQLWTAFMADYNSNMQDLINAMGDAPSALTTAAKSVVPAIKELKSNIGNASALDTSAKVVVPAINELSQLAGLAFRYRGGLVDLGDAAVSAAPAGIYQISTSTTNNFGLYAYAPVLIIHRTGIIPPASNGVAIVVGLDNNDLTRLLCKRVIY